MLSAGTVDWGPLSFWFAGVATSLAVPVALVFSVRTERMQREAELAAVYWWSERFLASGLRADLLTDGEWEALGRLFYDPELAAVCPTDRYPAHLRSNLSAPGRSGIMRPLHVGLLPVPHPPGPFDLVGNVWEWTRSRVFGRIDEADGTHPDYGSTAWLDGDPVAERSPTYPNRDAPDDLSYRATRGGSYFSLDEQAAWNPAYCLCDPPFSSYADLGFRFAVYPRA